VRRAAEQLKGLGARRVVLFGSLARGEWSPAADVDLAVLGLPPHLFWKAGRVAEEIVADCPVDLIPLEQAGRALLEEIERYGVDL
jgi:predicted nucleotidyltransferase